MCCSAGPDGRLPHGQPDGLPRSQPEPQAVLQGVAAKLQQQLTEGRLDKLSPNGRKAGRGGAADQAPAAVHIGSNKAVQADRSAPGRRQLRGLASLSSIAKRSPRAGSVTPRDVGNPEPGQQPGQLHMNGSHGRLAAGLETGIPADRVGSIEETHAQLATSAAAVAPPPAVSSSRVEAWTLEHVTAPRRLPPLNLSMQGPASPSTQISGDWVSYLCATCTALHALGTNLCRWSGPVCRWRHFGSISAGRFWEQSAT